MRKERIYILPTKFGALFILSAVIMILVGATYQNNLVNLLAFFMLSLIFVGMVQTHNNLKDIRVHAVEIENGFAQGTILVTVVLHNDSKDPRFNPEFGLKGMRPAFVYENVQPLLSQGTLKLRASFPAGPRGIYRLTRIKLSTIYPLGLFRSWQWHEIDSTYFIYPRPEGTLPFPCLREELGDSAPLIARGGEDFHGHRRFQEGDSARHIDWKARARGRPLLIKEFSEGPPGATLLDWNTLGSMTTEQRLSQLSAWIEEARRGRASFLLRLPDLTIPAGHGLRHATRCLETLAVHGLDSKGGPHGSERKAVG